jgi:putative nucleotidyltransferase with HDIG domain
MHGVAEYMYKHAADYNLDPEEMYLLGLLHDIGYLEGRIMHAQHGAAILKKIKLPHKYQIAVERQGDILKEKDHPSPELMLLIEADMHIISRSSKMVRYRDRLDEIAVSYGIDSKAYRICKANVRYLINHGRRS